LTDDLRYLTALKRRRAALSAKDDLLSFARLQLCLAADILYTPYNENFLCVGVQGMERAEAKKLGLTRYYTGRPCNHGHICERYTASLQCVECSNRISKARHHAFKPEDTRLWVAGGNPNRPSNSQEARTRYEQARFQKLKKDPERVIRKYLRSRFWNVMSGRSKSGSVMQYVGCSVGELRKHLQSLFSDGMTWENYGQWHVDHVRPCASFDLTDPAQVSKCWHYSNLQPLWGSENCSKRDRWSYAA